MKRITLEAPLLVIAFFLGTACSNLEKEYEIIKLKNPTDRLQMSGVSFQPPEADGWYFKKKNRVWIEIEKLGTKKDQSLYGAVVLSKMPDLQSEKEFLEFVSGEDRKRADDPRFEYILDEKTVTNEKETLSIRFHNKCRDYGVNGLAGTSPFLFVEKIGLVCLHPEKMDVGVSITLAQRFKAKDDIENFEFLAEEFIKNARIESFRKWGDEAPSLAFDRE